MSKSRSPKKLEETKKMIEIHLGIYRLTVVVFIEYGLEEIKKILNKKGFKMDDKSEFSKMWMRGAEDAHEDASGYCSTIGDKSPDVIVWVKKRPKTSREFGTLYHELYHAVDIIFYGIDREGKLGVSEPRAYLFEHLVTKCNQELWR